MRAAAFLRPSHRLTPIRSLHRDMKPEHAKFLFSLPLVIHVPSEHLFLVHGGLLPSDPRHPADDERQPLAHPPSPDDEVASEQLAADYDHPVLNAESLQRVFPRLSSVDLDRLSGDEIAPMRNPVRLPLEWYRRHGFTSSRRGTPPQPKN